MCRPSWWPRRCLSPWLWGDTGSSAHGQSTVLLFKLLSGNQTVTTRFQSGARWWSFALGVRAEYNQNKHRKHWWSLGCCVHFIKHLSRLCNGTPTAASWQGKWLCRETAEVLSLLPQPAPRVLRLCQVSHFLHLWLHEVLLKTTNSYVLVISWKGGNAQVWCVQPWKTVAEVMALLSTANYREFSSVAIQSLIQGSPQTTPHTDP